MNAGGHGKCAESVAAKCCEILLGFPVPFSALVGRNRRMLPHLQGGGARFAWASRHLLTCGLLKPGMKWQRSFAGTAISCCRRLFGVPWTEALHNQPFHPNFMADWERRKALTAGGLRTYLGITPLSMGRNDISEYTNEQENMALPAELSGKAARRSHREKGLPQLLPALDRLLPARIRRRRHRGELVVSVPPASSNGVNTSACMSTFTGN